MDMTDDDGAEPGFELHIDELVLEGADVQLAPFERGLRQELERLFARENAAGYRSERLQVRPLELQLPAGQLPAGQGSAGQGSADVGRALAHTLFGAVRRS